jgi:hypothetical protein
VEHLSEIFNCLKYEFIDVCDFTANQYKKICMGILHAQQGVKIYISVIKLMGENYVRNISEVS